MPPPLRANDNGAMTTVSREGVEFDIRPTCRGVWRDRGELEELITSGEAPGRPAPSPPGHPRPAPCEYRSETPGRFDRDDDGYRKKTRRDIFDTFD